MTLTLRQPAPGITARDTLADLDIAWSDELARRTEGITGPEMWRYAGRLFTVAMARDQWIEWQPEQRDRITDVTFLAHFHEFLAAGLDLGYRLSRFRHVAARLPNPDQGAKNWIPFFEETIAGDDCCTIRLFLNREQLVEFRTAVGGQTWDQMLAMLADGLFYELGLVFRPITVAVDPTLTASWFRCEWNDLRLPAQRGLDPDKLLVNDTHDRLRLLNVAGQEAVNPANGAECATIDRADEDKVKSAGLTTWDSRGYVVLALAAAIRQAAEAFVNRALYQLYLLQLRRLDNDLVTVLENTLDPDFVVQVLRGLLAEEISVRDLSVIFEAALELRATIAVDMSRNIVFAPPTGGVYPGAQERSLADLVPADYVEFIRARLRRYVSHKYTRGANTLVVYLMDPKAEEEIARPVLDDAAAESIKQAVRQEVASLPSTAPVPVILTTMEVRRKLRRLVAPEFPSLAVLSYQELSPDMNIQPIARISPE